jgi:hypothetical protein
MCSRKGSFISTFPGFAGAPYIPTAKAGGFTARFGKRHHLFPPKDIKAAGPKNLILELAAFLDLFSKWQPYLCWLLK